MNVNFDNISDLPDEAVQYLARPKKHFKHFDRQLTYLTTREFRTPGLTPVLPFDDSEPDQNASQRRDSHRRSAKRTKKCFHARVAPLPLQDTDLYPVIRSPEGLAAIAEMFCVVGAPTQAGIGRDQQANGNGDDAQAQPKKKGKGLSNQVRKIARRYRALQKGDNKTKVKPFNANDVDIPRKSSLISRLLKK